MQVLIYGSKGYAKLVAEIAIDAGHTVVGFLDDFSENSSDTYRFQRDDIIKNQTPVLLGVGYKDLRARGELLRKLMADGVHLPNLLHPRAYVHKSVKMGQGNILMADSFIDAFCEVGDGNVFWPHAMVSHDSTVASNNFLSPKALLCGFCQVGSGIFFGAGSVVVDGIHLTDEKFVKAAQLVTKSL